MFHAATTNIVQSPVSHLDYSKGALQENHELYCPCLELHQYVTWLRPRHQVGYKLCFINWLHIIGQREVTEIESVTKPASQCICI